MTSKSNQISSFFFHPWFQKDWKHNTKQCYLTTALHHNKSKMFKRNTAELRPLFRLSELWKKKAQIDRQRTDVQVRLWDKDIGIYSVWRMEARLKGSEKPTVNQVTHSDGWEHLKTWCTLKCEPVGLQWTARCGGALNTHDITDCRVITERKDQTNI